MPLIFVGFDHFSCVKLFRDFCITIGQEELKFCYDLYIEWLIGLLSV